MRVHTGEVLAEDRADCVRPRAVRISNGISSAAAAAPAIALARNKERRKEWAGDRCKRREEGEEEGKRMKQRDCGRGSLNGQ